MEEMDDRRSFLKRMALGAAMIVAAPFVGKAAQVEKVVSKEDFKFPKFKGGSASYTTLSGAGEQKEKIRVWDTFSEGDHFGLTGSTQWLLPDSIHGRYHISDNRVTKIPDPGMSVVALTKDLEKVMDNYAFEFNDGPTRMALTMTMWKVLQGYVDRGIITDYIVTCNETNNPPGRTRGIDVRINIQACPNGKFLTQEITACCPRTEDHKGVTNAFLRYESDSVLQREHVKPSVLIENVNPYAALQLRDLCLTLQDSFGETVFDNTSAGRFVAIAVARLILDQAKESKIIDGFSVVCNDTNNPPDLVAQNTMVVDVSIDVPYMAKPLQNRITFLFPGVPSRPS